MDAVTFNFTRRTSIDSFSFSGFIMAYFPIVLFFQSLKRRETRRGVGINMHASKAASLRWRRRIRWRTRKQHRQTKKQRQFHPFIQAGRRRRRRRRKKATAASGIGYRYSKSSLLQLPASSCLLLPGSNTFASVNPGAWVDPRLTPAHPHRRVRLFASSQIRSSIFLSLPMCIRKKTTKRGGGAGG